MTIEDFFDNVRNLQKSIVIQRSLNNFPTTIMYLTQDDLKTIEEALIYVNEHQREIRQEYMQHKGVLL